MADQVNSVYKKVERNRSIDTDDVEPEDYDQDDDSNTQFFVQENQLLRQSSEESRFSKKSDE